jgi:hypothetical protein
MAKRKRTPSPYTPYRRARGLVAELESQLAKLERSRPRTPGKKGARTRTLKKLRRRLGAARGRLTKARNAIAAATRTRSTISSAARLKRSAAAKKGWATRLARAAVADTADDKFMPMLTRTGIAWVNPVGDDRSLLATYWTVLDDVVNYVPTFLLDGFEGLSIVDAETGERYYFVTDIDTILSFHDHFDFGPSFYKSRGEVAKQPA